MTSPVGALGDVPWALAACVPAASCPVVWAPSSSPVAPLCALPEDGITTMPARSSTEVICRPTVTSRERSPSLTVPPGTDSPDASIAAVMSDSARPASASFCASGVMRTMSVGAPASMTEETPSTRSSSGITSEFRRWARTAGSSSEETERTTAGMSPLPPAMTCGSASSGSWSSMRESAASTWLALRAVSVP